MIQRFEQQIPSIDKDAFVHETAVLIGAVSIAQKASIWPGAVLRGDMGKISIGQCSNIQDGSILHMTHNISEVIVGDRVTVGHGVILHGCTVNEESLIGMGAIILDNCIIGKGSFIAAGSLLTPNTKIPPLSLVRGSPAKVIRQVNENEINMIATGWQSYVETIARYKAALN